MRSRQDNAPNRVSANLSVIQEENWIVPHAINRSQYRRTIQENKLEEMKYSYSCLSNYGSIRIERVNAISQAVGQMDEISDVYEDEKMLSASEPAVFSNKPQYELSSP